MSVCYHTREITVTVHRAEHDGTLFNQYPKDWLGSKNLTFEADDLIITFSDGVQFVLHPELGKRLLER